MISRDTIDRIRARIDLAALVGETVKLQRRGRSHVGLCPFHQEKSPSFTVSEERGLFHCFGCKTSGDCFKFVELTEGCSFGEALRKLAERAGVELVDDDRSDEQRSADARAKKAKEALYGVNALAAGFFERMLLEHPHASFAREELARRGLPIDGPAADALRAFKIGYAPHGWDALANFLRQNGVSPAQAEEVGLLAPRTKGPGYYDAFRHRLMVAISDVQGRVVAFSGRTLPAVDPIQEEGRPAPPKYVNSRESQIYSKGSTLFGLFQARNAIRARGECVVVEGNFDLVAMNARGVEHVVAPLGTAFTPEQARLLRKFCSSVTLLFDADAAGRKATWAARATCKDAGLSARVARMPAGKDPDEFLRAKGERAKEAMEEVLAAARSLDEVLVDDLCDPIGEGTNLASKQAALQKIRPLLEEQELVVRDVLVKRVASRLGLDAPTLWRLMKSPTADVDRGGVAARGAERVKGGAAGDAEQEALSRSIVERLFVCPEVLEEPHIGALERWLPLVTGEWAFAVAALRTEMRLSRQENRTFDLTRVLAQLPQAIQEAAAAKLAEPVLETMYRSSGKDSRKVAAVVLAEDPDGRPDPLEACRLIRDDGVKLEKAVAKARFAEIERELARAEASGDLERASRLVDEKIRLTRSIRAAADEAARPS